MTPVPAADAHPDFRERITGINLRRMCWYLVLAMGLDIAIFLASHFEASMQDRGASSVLVTDLGISLSFVAIAVLFMWKKPPLLMRQGFVIFFVTLELVLSAKYFFELLPTFGYSTVYVLGVFSLSIIMLIRPQIFFPIVLVIHAIFLVNVSHSGLPPEKTVNVFVDTTLAVAFSMFGLYFLYTGQKNNFTKEQLLSAQSASLAAANGTLRLRHEELQTITEIATHDLRSPLLGLMHLLRFAEDAQLAPERRRQVLTEAEQTCGRMLGQINRWLDAHELEAESRPAASMATDLAATVREAVARAQSLIEGRDITLRLSAPPAVAAAHPAEDLATVLDNLLANAVKFSPAGGAVEVELTARENGWQLAVRDRGPGVPPEEVSRIFEKHFHGRLRPPGGEKGSGLGLYIAHALTRRMGGVLRYEDRPGGGSVFLIEWLEAISG